SLSRTSQNLATLEPADLHRQRRPAGARRHSHGHRPTDGARVLAVELVSGSRTNRVMRMPHHIRRSHKLDVTRMDLPPLTRFDLHRLLRPVRGGARVEPSRRRSEAAGNSRFHPPLSSLTLSERAGSSSSSVRPRSRTT